MLPHCGLCFWFESFLPSPEPHFINYPLFFKISIFPIPLPPSPHPLKFLNFSSGFSKTSLHSQSLFVLTVKVSLLETVVVESFFFFINSLTYVFELDNLICLYLKQLLIGKGLCVLVLSHVWLFATAWTVAHQGSSVHGIFQARILEWIAIFYSEGSFWPRDQTCVSCIYCLGRQMFYHWTT